VFKVKVKPLSTFVLNASAKSGGERVHEDGEDAGSVGGGERLEVVNISWFSGFWLFSWWVK